MQLRKRGILDRCAEFSSKNLNNVKWFLEASSLVNRAAIEARMDASHKRIQELEESLRKPKVSPY